tara:strand:- start:17046 stop:17798 length:753 start_codon:yes stop_codon:yes gene_type:complete
MDYLLEDFLGLGNTNPIKKSLKASLLSKDREICGLFYFDENQLDYDFIQLDNQSQADKNYFTIKDKKFYDLFINDRIVSLFHTHTLSYDESPSELDIEVSESLSLPSMIFSLKTKSYNLYFPKSHKPRPLERRIFIPYFQDCVSFIKDYFYFKFNIKMQDSVLNWARKRQDPNDFLMEQVDKMFFDIPFREIKEHDLIIFKPSIQPFMHLAVYLGSNEIFHHPIGGYPRKELFTPESMNKVYKICRYKDL